MGIRWSSFQQSIPCRLEHLTVVRFGSGCAANDAPSCRHAKLVTRCQGYPSHRAYGSLGAVGRRRSLLASANSANAGGFAVRDTIGTLAALTFDIITLFVKYHCYGGAPNRRARPAGRAPRLDRHGPSRETCDNRNTAPFGAPLAPHRGWMEQRQEKPGRTNAPRERRRLCCLTL